MRSVWHRTSASPASFTSAGHRVRPRIGRGRRSTKSPPAFPLSAGYARLRANVLIALGVELAGSFPADLQQDLVFTAAVAAGTKEAAAAKAFIDFLQMPEAAAVLKAKGMTPG